jgi:hypothetical protein
MNAADAAAVAFVCPWCPVTVVGFGEAADDARRLIEHHLDEHLSQESTVSIPEPRQPPRTTSDTHAAHAAA